MIRLRIVCRAEPRQSVGGFVCGVLPSLDSTEVYAVADDGTETLLTNVESVGWWVSTNEPARAQVTFTDVEVDVTGQLPECPVFADRNDPSNNDE